MVFVSALNLILFNWWQKKEDRRAAATIRECPKFTASRELGSSNNRRPRLKTWERPRCRRFSLKTLFTESSHRRCWEQVRVAPAALVESLPCKSSQLTHTLFWAPELLNWDLDKVAFQKGDLRDKHISKNLIWDVYRGYKTSSDHPFMWDSVIILLKLKTAPLKCADLLSARCGLQRLTFTINVVSVWGTERRLEWRITKLSNSKIVTVKDCCKSSNSHYFSQVS